jgi:ribonuclease Z
MRPLLHPTLLNGRTGDPALYIETLFERRAVLFDLGDITALPPRKIQRLDQVFVSHAHIDHFFGFDRLLRVLVGRDKQVNLYGPESFIEHVHHKLQSYRWNLVERYPCDLIFVVVEIHASLACRTTRFRLKNAFAPEPLATGVVTQGIVHREPGFLVSAAVLEHRTACLGFAMQEAAHVNVWKNRLAELGLPVGPWLRELKRAVTDSAFAGLGAPKGTPAEIIEILNREVTAGLADPNVKARIFDLGGTPLPASAAEFGTLVAAETEKWGRVVKLSGARAN